MIRPTLALMAASGFAGLGWQIVWTRQCALWLGHESAAVLAVVAAFFAGLAAGALVLGPRIERSARPARWYAACEAAIALWGALLLFAMAPASDALLALTGPQPTPAWQWAVAFFGSWVLLLPATAAMGATLPAMARVTALLRAEGQAIAALYAANTAGAVLGVLAAALWLVPGLGLRATAGLCIAINAWCAATSLFVFGRTAPPQPARLPMLTSTVARLRPGPLAVLALTGLLGIGYEVLVVRVISQLAEDTVYTFALLLAVYLVGTAVGAAWIRRRLAGPTGSPAASDRLRDRLLLALAFACLASAASLWAGASIQRTAFGLLLEVSGSAVMASLAAEALLALLAFGLPTAIMGALFSQLCVAAGGAGVGFARCLAVNTLGAALAPLLFGVWLLPWLGAKGVLVLIAVGYLALTARPAGGILGTRLGARGPHAGWPAAAALSLVIAMAVAIAMWAPPLSFVDVPPGGRVLSHDEGVMAAVSVVEDAEGVARLRIDNRAQEGSSTSGYVDGRQALLPVLLHPAPRRALFLGLGTGVTAYSAALDPALRVDAVELLPEVIAASTHFTQALRESAPGARVHLMVADARRFVRAGGERYDLIVSDNFHPARSGSGALYTVEHFGAVRGRLAAGGLFCQWLPLHQLDLGTLRSIVKSFVIAFPEGRALLASNSLQTPVLGLVGTADGSAFDAQRVRERLAQAQSTWPRGPAAFGIEDEFALFGSFVAGPAALARFAADADANTDDRPIVAYRAPRITYAPDSLPRDRLVALLHGWAIEPAELVGAVPDAAWPDRLAAYWAARNQYIEAGRSVRPSADAAEMLAQVRAPLLAALRRSPDFRPAYDPLLQMAAALARSDTPAARALLVDLTQAQPARPEAAQALRQLEAP